jgi:hypothetical protein
MTKSADHVISQSFDHKTLSVKKKVTALNTEVKTIKTNEMLSIDTVGIENKTQQDSRINKSKKPKIEINKSTNNCIEDAKVKYLKIYIKNKDLWWWPSWIFD